MLRADSVSFPLPAHAAVVRSLFCSAGLFVLLWGIALLFVDTVTIRHDVDWQHHGSLAAGSAAADETQTSTLRPPAWLGYVTVTIGSVTMLYAVALPKRD